MTLRRLWETATYYCNRVGLAPRCRGLVFYETEVRPQSLDSSHDGVEIAVLGPESLEAVAYCGGWLNRHEALQKLQTTTCWMVAAVHEGRMLGYVWGESVTAYLDFFDLRIQLPDDTIYLSRRFVHSEARGRGLAQALNARLLAEAARRGASRVFSCADVKNAAEHNLQVKIGGRRYLTAFYLRLIGWRLYRICPAVGAHKLTTSDPAAAAEALLRLGSSLDSGC